MPSSPSHPTDPPSRQHQQSQGYQETHHQHPQGKLRASCDACAASKVRCSRERPVCARCASSKVPVSCYYAPSQKFGRAPRPKKRTCLITPALAIPLAPQSARPQTRPQLDPRTPSSSTDTNNPKEADTGIASLESTDSAFPACLTPSDTHYSTDVSNQSPSSQAIASSATDDLQRHNGRLDEYQMFGQAGSFDFSDDWLKVTLQSTPDSWDYSPPSEATTDGTVFPNLLSTPQLQTGGGPSRASALHGDPLPSRTSFPQEIEHGGGHQCYNVLSSTLSFLCGHGQANNHLPSDSTLLKIRSAVVNVTRFLTCTCAKDPTALLLAASTMSQILQEYQKLSRVNQPIAPCRHESTEGPAEGSSSPLGSGSSRIAISMGNFTPDESDQDALALQIVFGEVKKMFELVERLNSREHDLNVDFRRSVDHSALPGFLASWLQNEVTRTLKDIRDRLQRTVAAAI